MAESPLPHYERVKRLIDRRIASGEWPPGTRIPSEFALVRELGVSRMTINRALRELSLLGRLRRVQGVGSFVAEAKPHSALFEVRNIAVEIAERGHRHEASIHRLAAERAPAEIAAGFGLSPGAKVFHSILVHSENDLPVQIEDRFVDPRIAKDYLAQDFRRETPFVYLSRLAPITEAEHEIEAVLPAAWERRLLKIPSGEPCLSLQRRTWSEGKPVSQARLLYPGSRYRLQGRWRP